MDKGSPEAYLLLGAIQRPRRQMGRCTPVTEAGRVASTLVFLDLGFGLDEQATAAAQKPKFKPGTRSR